MMKYYNRNVKTPPYENTLRYIFLSNNVSETSNLHIFSQDNILSFYVSKKQTSIIII